MIPVTLHWTNILLMISYMGFCGVFALKIEMENIGLVAIPLDLDPSVVYLNLDRNHITAISESSLSNYTELQIFFIRQNDISYIHRLAFVHNTKLSRLSVVSNTHLVPGEWLIPLRSTLNAFGVARIEIESLEDIGIRDFRHLRYIFATVHCDRETILNVTCLSTELASLSIRDAGLTNISSVTHLKRLTVINFSGNNLNTIPDLFNHSLDRIGLEGNHLRCDYDLCWLRLWNFVNRTIDIDGSFVCASPDELDGQEVMSVNPANFGCFRGEWYKILQSTKMESIFHICVIHRQTNDSPYKCINYAESIFMVSRLYLLPLGAPNVKQNNFNQNSYHMILDLSERIKHVRIIWHDGHRCCGFIIYNIL